MKVTQRVLAIIAVLVLISQTVRHVYVRWLQPRASVLDRFDRPLKDRISSASTLEELLTLYEPVRREADAKRKEARNERKDTYDLPPFQEEPFRSENELRQAITSWEAKAKEIHALRFYWVVGAIFVVIGAILFGRGLRWLGLSLEAVGFTEMVYWTSPTFFGGGQEFERLVTYKVVLSLLSLVLFALVARRQAAFSEGNGASKAV